MTAHLTLLNVQIPGYAGLQQVRIAHSRVIAIAPTLTPQPEPSLDLEGDWLSLGGVDLQINGALGLAFPDLAPQHTEKLTKICQFLWHQGIDAFLPTIVTTSLENIQRSLTTLSPLLSPPRFPSPAVYTHLCYGHNPCATPLSPPLPRGETRVLPLGKGELEGVDDLCTHSSFPAAQILGVHLEGPFLNPTKRGAHPAEYLLPLTLEQVKRVLGSSNIVKVMTLAPELDATGEVIPYLRSRGITVSLGHSMATADQATQAFNQGATMVTHAFNAMPPLHHREPGLLAAAITHPNIACGLIADGQHVSPLMVDILLRASRDRADGLDNPGVFLVSDALSPLGLPDGIYPWDTRQIQVQHGTARLPDGTLSGTTLSLLVGVQNLVQWGICDVQTAIALATLAPRRAFGLTTDYIGQPVTHLLRWHNSEDGVSWQRLTFPE